MTGQQWQDELAKEYRHLRDIGMPGYVYECVCAVCNRKFYARRPESKYCSYGCDRIGASNRRRELAQNRRQKVCIHCHKSFKANRKDGMYCSAKCKQAAYRVKLLRISVFPTLAKQETVTSVTDKSLYYIAPTQNGNEQQKELVEVN
jgi:hypothetical protein